MKKILFVCLGNICRSPAAEGVMRHLLHEQGMEDEVLVDSAGTIDEHEGQLPDPRMRAAASQRGLSLDSRSRPITPKDLEVFDFILTMDDQNRKDVEKLDARPEIREKIIPFVRFLHHSKDTFVPDPYYGGPDGFEKVLDLMEEGCAGILNHLLR